MATGVGTSGSLFVILAFIICAVEWSRRWLESIHLLAVHIVREESVGCIAPLYLDALTHCWTSVWEIGDLVGRYDVVIDANLCFLWKRFQQ